MVSHTHCCYCRRKFEESGHLKKTKDHFYPSSRLGMNVLLNLLQCCWECNQWKADKMPEDWLDEVKGFSERGKNKGNYRAVDFAQIVGSLRHFIRQMKGKKIAKYKY